jgi:methylthioribose-1-phosphate isomerase
MLPLTIEWEKKTPLLRLLDQRNIPQAIDFCECRTYEEVADSIEKMAVRGAPAIGVAAAYGVALAAYKDPASVETAIERLAVTRPTAVNLYWALERMRSAAGKCGDKADLYSILESEAIKIHEEDILINRRIGFNGQMLLPMEAVVITHCNAGALATAGYGTALGVFRAAREQGKKLKIYADETRPRLQGSRLTAFELYEDNFDVTVICDSMAAFLMSREKIDAVITGADRVAINGDTANKIGTYSLAIAAKRHNVPFYIAAPTNTIDIYCPNGEAIPIEERDPDEIRCVGDFCMIPEKVNVWNPAFDVTPAELISGIITEAGVFKPWELIRHFRSVC